MNWIRGLSFSEMFFVLALVSILLVYYQAVIKEVPVGANAAVQLGNLFFGRNAAGNYPNYPK